MTKFSRNKLRGRITELYGSQQKFAEAIGGTQVSISFILTGKNNPTSDTIYTWVQALQINTEEIGDYFFTPEIKETR